jgi:hypothetical protein
LAVQRRSRACAERAHTGLGRRRAARGRGQDADDAGDRVSLKPPTSHPLALRCRTSSQALRSLFLRASAGLSDRDEISSKSSASLGGHRKGLELRKSPPRNDLRKRSLFALSKKLGNPSYTGRRVCLIRLVVGVSHPRAVPTGNRTQFRWTCQPRHSWTAFGVAESGPNGISQPASGCLTSARSGAS